MTDMLTQAAPDTAGLWLTISGLASRKGVTKQTISERVARLVADGKITTRKGGGKAKLVNLAEYDRAVGETTDLLKQQAADTVKARDEAPPLAPGDPTFTEAQKQNAIYSAGIKALEYAERRGSVLPIEGAGGVAEAMSTAAEKIVRGINALPNRSGDIAAELKCEEGPVRIMLKRLARDLRETVGRELRLLEAQGKQREAAGGVEVDVPTPDEMAA